MTWNHWLAVAAVNGLISVAAGAFGAHALKDSPRLEVFQTGARYQMFHALALVAVAWLASRGGGAAVQASGFSFVIGIVLFSGSLYALTLGGAQKLGMITPLGGLALMLGWALLAWAALHTAP